jgi:hypothetical protein
MEKKVENQKAKVKKEGAFLFLLDPPHNVPIYDTTEIVKT